MEASNEKATQAEAKPEPSAAKTSALVDTLFDALTLQTAKGLVLAKDALETVARWLDARAKLVGDLASKLSSTAPGTSST